MPAPWAETPTKVVVEFKRSSGGVKRTIQLAHSAVSVPPQLAGRVAPQAWQALMADVERLAATHPYVVKPSAGRMCGWVGGFAMACCIGFGCFNPDGGDWGAWLADANAVVARHQQAFAASGCHLSLQRAQQSYWIQVDVTGQPAVGQPATLGQPAPPPMPAGYAKPGYEAGKF